jgi:hypothetical protein
MYGQACRVGEQFAEGDNLPVGCRATGKLPANQLRVDVCVHGNLFCLYQMKAAIAATGLLTDPARKRVSGVLTCLPAGLRSESSTPRGTLIHGGRRYDPGNMKCGAGMRILFDHQLWL